MERFYVYCEYDDTESYIPKENVHVVGKSMTTWFKQVMMTHSHASHLHIDGFSHGEVLVDLVIPNCSGTRE